MNRGIFNLLSSIFTHSVQDVRRHVLLPVTKEKKTSFYKLYIDLQKECGIPALLLWPNHREPQKNKESIPDAITLG